MEKIVNLLAALGTVALVAVIVQSPNTSSVLRAFGDSWSNITRASMGK